MDGRVVGRRLHVPRAADRRRADHGACLGARQVGLDGTLTTRLERTFLARVDGLPAETRTLLTVAALDDGTELTDMLAATAVLAGRPVGLDAARPASDAGDPRLLAVLALTDANAHAVAVLGGLEESSADADGQPDVAGLLGIAGLLRR